MIIICSNLLISRYCHQTGENVFMKRKTILILMIPIMILTALSAAAESEPAPDYTTGTPWLYVDLIGNVTEETETNLKDNFALAVNKEALLKLEIPEGMPANGTGESTFFQAMEDIAKMFTEGTATSRDAQLAFNLYALMTDWDSRNALGAAPLKEDTDTLERITSVDELNRYFTEVPYEHQMPAPWDCSAEEDSWNEGKWVINIGWTNLLKEDSAEYANETLSGKNRIEAKTALAKNVLIKLGYSAAEADGKIEACIAFENMLAPSVFTGEEQSLTGFYSRINNPLTREELAEAGGRLPLFGYIEKACGYPEFDRFNVLCPENLSALSRLYTDENLELIKSYMIVHGVIDRAGYLDRESYELKYISDHIDYGDVTIPDDAEASVEYLESQLPWAVSRLYTETYLHREDKERLTGLLEKMTLSIIRSLRTRNFSQTKPRRKPLTSWKVLTFRYFIRTTGRPMLIPDWRSNPPRTAEHCMTQPPRS